MTQEHDTDGPKAYGLYPIDRHIQTRLLDACRAMLTRATPTQVRDLAYLMHALHRLPSTTPGVRGGVTFPIGPDDSAVSRGFELNDDEFILTTVESVDLGDGTDYGSRNVLVNGG